MNGCACRKCRGMTALAEMAGEYPDSAEECLCLQKIQGKDFACRKCSEMFACSQ